jgi:hypothetical protein
MSNFVKYNGSKYILVDNIIQGPEGDKGPKGPQGDQGVIGLQGTQGVAGISGIKGIQGDQGPTGFIGDTGAIGPIGDAGPKGPDGYIGPQGPIGDQGVPGPIGEIGAQGASGGRIPDRGVYSMLPPLGEFINPAPPIVVYDFTNAYSSLSAAQNLESVNKSGNNELHLTTTSGSAVFEYAMPRLIALTGGTYRLPTPRVTNATYINSSNLRSNVTPLLQITGSLTIEFISTISTSNVFFDCFSTGSGEEFNRLYKLEMSSTANFRYSAQRDNNVNISATLSSGGSSSGSGVVLYTLVRNSDGHVRLFIQGAPVSDWVIPTSTDSGSIIPTGGTSSYLRINTINSNIVCLGMRIFDYALSDLQIQESHKSTFFGFYSEVI